MSKARRVPFWGEKLSQARSVPALPETDETSNPIESLAAASPETLQELMLSRMNTAANLRKDIALLIAELAEQLADAKLAEMLLAQKSRKRDRARLAKSAMVVREDVG